MKRIPFLLIFFINDTYAQSIKDNTKVRADIQQQVWNLTEVMYHDAVNPPAAARFYAYSMLTGYEILSQLDPSVVSFQKKFKDYVTTKLQASSLVNTELAVLFGILETGKNIIPSGYLLEEKQQQLLSTFRSNGLAASIVDSSVSFAKIISKSIIHNIPIQMGISG